MNIFYTPPEQIRGDQIELKGQEAIHASKALRYEPGDNITVVDGEGGWYEGKISSIATERVQIAVVHSEKKPPIQPAIMLAMGIIKKRDRLEFAVEKAVELGVKKVALFTGDHSVKQNVRDDRLESIVISAMKQSLQAWLPQIDVYHSLDEVIEANKKSKFWVADQQGERFNSDEVRPSADELIVLLVGPEGGFSKREIETINQQQCHFKKIHPNRLRTETAALVFLSLCRSR